jgi:nucleoside-diphosphate-sugar epimerase
MTGGEQQRDFIHVDDVLSGFLQAAVRGVDGRSYDLGWGHTHSLKEVIDHLYDLLQATPRPEFGVLPYRPGEIWNMQADPAPSKRDLGWSPRIGLKEGLLLTAKVFHAT